MPFVKLDTRILDSTLWVERGARDLFITALLMAEPWETTGPLEAIEVRSMKPTGFVVPASWYGLIAAAGIGIIRRSLLGEPEGYEALEALGRPDPESRSDDFDGRRLVRVDGGYIVLNFMKYRDRDYGAAERMKRLRERKKNETVTPNVTPVHPNVTHAEAEAEAEVEKQSAQAPREAVRSGAAQAGATARARETIDPLTPEQRRLADKAALRLVEQRKHVNGSGGERAHAAPAPAAGSDPKLPRKPRRTKAEVKADARRLAKNENARRNRAKPDPPPY